MELSAEKIKRNWELHLKIADRFITDRKKPVIKMLKELEDKIVLAPASSKTWFHNAFPGGYVDHVNRVVQYSLKQLEFFKEMGGKIDFSEEELVFSALFHDLGKIGDGEKEGYIKQTDNWRKKNLQEEYTINKELDFMLIQDRSLYILQKYQIPVSQQEYLGIKLHDGLYDESNKSYFISFNPDSKLRTNLVYLLHSADVLASKVEYDLNRK